MVDLLVKAAQGELVASFTKGPIGIVEFVATVVTGAILACLGDLVLTSVTSFLAGIIVYVKYAVIMMVFVVIGQTLGSGCLTLGMASFLGC